MGYFGYSDTDHVITIIIKNTMIANLDIQQVRNSAGNYFSLQYNIISTSHYHIWLQVGNASLGNEV